MKNAQSYLPRHRSLRCRERSWRPLQKAKQPPRNQAKSRKITTAKTSQNTIVKQAGYVLHKFSAAFATVILFDFATLILLILQW
jgi:hypothetical protein